LPSIFYQCSDYKNNFLHLNTNEEGSLQCRKLDLYRSMVTVGNPSFISKKKIKEYGLARAIYGSVIEKVGLVHENIESNSNGMRLHPIYHTHVSDKKRIVSYNLGMAFAKYYAEKLLSVPRLIHVESLKTYGAIDFTEPQEGRGREPDLVGRCVNGNWHVFEAKGMSVNQVNAKLLSAKEQVKSVKAVDGVTPETLNACATYFNNKRIFTHLVDPEGKGDKRYKVDSRSFVDAAYKSIFLIEDALDRKLELSIEDGLRYYSVNVEAKGVNLKVGIEEEVHDLLRQEEFEQIPEVSRSRALQEIDSFPDRNISVGMDGVVVKYRGF
jgi:hypothetical protein